VVSNVRSALDGTPASKLPPEILSQIFACLRTPEIPPHYYTLEDMWMTLNESLAAVNLVCRYWRQVAIGTKAMWTHIAVVDTLGPKKLHLMLELFLKRAGSHPLSLTISRTDDHDHDSCTFHAMEPSVHRLRTLIVDGPGINPSEFHFFSQPAPLLEELTLVCLPDIEMLPRLFEGSTPRLRMLDLVGRVPEPTNRFYNLSTLALGPSEIEDFDNLLLMLEDSPRLEHLYLQQSRLVHSPEVAVPKRSAKVHYLKTLSLSEFSEEGIRTLFLSLSLPQHNLALRFADIRSKGRDFSRIYPPDFPPQLSIFTTTSLEIRIEGFYCAFNAVGPHAATAIQWHSHCDPHLSSSAVTRHVAQGPFNLVKELWIPSHTGYTKIPLAFPALELLVIGRENAFALHFSDMLAPREGEVPSPRIMTIEIRGHLDHALVAEFAAVLHDRANAGRRLKKLRMKRRDGEVSLLPLEHEVDELELLGELGDGMELPEICETDLGDRWLSWRRDPSKHHAWSR
jgi:hypothetical protein